MSTAITNCVYEKFFIYNFSHVISIVTGIKCLLLYCPLCSFTLLILPQSSVNFAIVLSADVLFTSFAEADCTIKPNAEIINNCIGLLLHSY